MTYKIKFGTDGWRGKIAEDYTFENVRRCTQGFANLSEGNLFARAGAARHCRWRRPAFWR